MNNTTPYDYLLTFINPEHGRPICRTLVKQDNSIYATDGCHLIRVPYTPDFPLPYTENEGFNLSQLIQPKKKLVKFPSLPAPVSCDFCDGTAKITNCESCDGQGYFEHYDYHYFCKNCDESGKVPYQEGSDKPFYKCLHCYNGESYNKQKLKLGSGYYCVARLRQLNTLPNLILYPKYGEVHFYEKILLYFKFEHGDGILLNTKP